MVQAASSFQPSERREHSSEPRTLGLLSRRLGIKSLCGVLFSNHPSELLSCVRRNFFEAEIGPVHGYFLSSLFRRVQTKPEGKSTELFIITVGMISFFMLIYNNNRITICAFWSIPLLDQSHPFLLDPHLWGEIRHLEKTKNDENMTEGEQTQR